MSDTEPSLTWNCTICNDTFTSDLYGNQDVSCDCGAAEVTHTPLEVVSNKQAHLIPSTFNAR